MNCANDNTDFNTIRECHAYACIMELMDAIRHLPEYKAMKVLNFLHEKQERFINGKRNNVS
jgi:hypothetical protein